MQGILTLSVLVAGLGLLYPGEREGDANIGTRLAAGVSLLLIAYYALSVLLKIPLRMGFYGVGALALTGFTLGVFRASYDRLREVVLHPAVLLTLLAVTAVVAHHGVDYIPFTTDEFTNWIGVSRQIHWAGSYESVRESLSLPGYTPGWRLLLLLPWQLTGAMEYGHSAAVPLILHIAALALIFDLLTDVLRREASLPPGIARLWAWLVLLLLLAAEGMGRLWTHELLVEQPQVYTISMAALLILKAELRHGQRHVLYLTAGLVLGAGYLIKNAALATLPAAVLVAAVPILSTGSKRENLRDAAICATALIVPPAFVVISWGAIAPVDGCLASPRQLLILSASAFEHNWIDLARRYGAAVLSYVAGYKLVLTVAAAAGFVLASRHRLIRAALFWAIFSGVYLISLYWFHLTCFGDYLFQELNSIPRFTRVPLQVFHTIGLVLLTISIILSWPLYLRGQLAPLARIAGTRLSVVGAAIVVVMLAGWQVRGVHRTVIDLSTRAFQNIDPRIAEMADASNFVVANAGSLFPARPAMAILGQGQDRDVLAYASYFGTRRGSSGVPEPVYELYRATSWAPEAMNVWQMRSSPEHLAASLRDVDILWPIQVDAWLREVLTDLVPDHECVAALPRFALVRHVTVSGNVEFRCVSKRPP